MNCAAKVKSKITEMPGIGIPEERVFNAAGVRTIEGAYLLLVSVSPELESQLSEALGWSIDQLETFKCQCEMTLNIDNLGTIGVMCLSAVDVTSITGLSAMDAVAAHGKIDKSREEGGNLKVKKIPSLGQLETWKAQAKCFSEVPHAA